MIGRVGKYIERIGRKGFTKGTFCITVLAFFAGSICLFSGISVWAQAPDFRWVRQVGGESYTDSRNWTHSQSSTYAMTLDGHASLVVAGYVNVSNPSFIGPEDTNYILNGSYLAKFDPAGDLLWTKSIGTNGQFLGVAADSVGDIYTAGYTNVAYFSNGAPQSLMTLIKYDSMGRSVWSVQCQGDSEDDGMQITIDAATNIYLTGIFSSSNFVIGSITLTNDFVRQVFANWRFEEFIAKFDASGNLLWAKALPGSDAIFGVLKPRVDVWGNISVFGLFSRPLMLESITLTNSSTEDVFWIRYDAQGNLMSARDIAQVGFGGEVYASQDTAGNIYLGGEFQTPSPTVGTVTLTNSSTAIYLAKLDTNGNTLWTRQPAAPKYSGFQGGSLYVDAAGNVYQAGNASASNINFGNFQLNSPVNNTGYVAKFDSAGNFLWAAQMYATQGPLIPSVGASLVEGDVFGNLYLSGMFTGGAFGNLTVNAATANESFLAKLDGPRVNLLTTNGQAVISWPTSATGLNLESTVSLGGSWFPVTNAPDIAGNNYVLTNSLTPGARFYRLRNF